MIIQVPKPDKKAWPTLGPYVVDYMIKNLVHGPGDLLGEELRLDQEQLAWVYCLYEVYPKRHPRAGRRRYEQAALSLRKGVSKTEFAALISGCELAPDAPVRTVDWDHKGYPIGGPVADPYIPMVAYTEQQTEELAYGALRVILMESRIAAKFDIGLERIMRLDGHGKAEALATSPNAADGARTTFQNFDETHRFVLPRLKKAHATMLANIPKRREADAWSLETTTAFAPGENSVAEQTMARAQAIIEGKVSDPAFFFYHRSAGDSHDLTTKKGCRAAIAEATGKEAMAWAGDIDKILRQLQNPPDGNRSYAERVWLNRVVRDADRAFDVELWRRLAKPKYAVAKGALIVLGFDGSRRRDSTGLVGVEIETGFLWPLECWEKPENAGDSWEIPQLEVEAAMAAAFEQYNIWRVYADPPYWEETVAKWSGQYGEERVVSWRTQHWRKYADAVRSFYNAIADGSLRHDGDQTLARHIANAYRRKVYAKDENGLPLWILQKERGDSPNKIDLATCAVLAWEARRDALTTGADKAPPPEGSVYNDTTQRPGGFLSVDF